MPQHSPESDAEIGEIFARLREEVRASGSTVTAVDDARPLSTPVLARKQAQRLWAVTAERPYLYRPGRWGRVRGLALVPVKAVLRRLMRWYVEPFATDQRAFNAAVLRMVDELSERIDRDVARLERALAQLEERVAPSPRAAEERSSSTSPATPPS